MLDLPALPSSTCSIIQLHISEWFPLYRLTDPLELLLLVFSIKTHESVQKGIILANKR